MCIKRNIIYLIILIYILTGCSLTKSVTSNRNDDCKDGCEIDLTNDDTLDQDIPANDIGLEVITFDKALEYALSNETTGVFMLSFAGCQWCEVALPLVEEIANKYLDIKTYYVDITKDERTEDESTYDQYYNLVKPFLEERGYEMIYIPAFVFIKNGVIVKYHTGISAETTELTDDEKNLFREVLVIGYELIKKK